MNKLHLNVMEMFPNLACKGIEQSLKWEESTVMV